MDIKQENVSVLLGKINELLGSLPEEVKKGEKFLEAEKALNQLDKLLAGKEGEKSLLACRGSRPTL